MSRCSLKYAVAGVVAFLAILMLWWHMLGNYRSMQVDVQSLQANVQQMQKHVVESERLLRMLDSLKQEVRDARVQSNAALEDSCRLAGDERIDYLVRLLETDLARRGGVGAPGGVVGAVPGTGGSAGGSGASEKKTHR